MDDTNIQKEILHEIKNLSKIHAEILSVLSLFALTNTEKRLTNIFSNSSEYVAYKLTNGINTSKEIGKKTNVSQQTVSRWWKKWDEKFGIVETSGYRNPYKAKYSLIELALLFGKSQDIE